MSDIILFFNYLIYQVYPRARGRPWGPRWQSRWGSLGVNGRKPPFWCLLGLLGGLLALFFANLLYDALSCLYFRRLGSFFDLFLLLSNYHANKCQVKLVKDKFLISMQLLGKWVNGTMLKIRKISQVINCPKVQKIYLKPFPLKNLFK